MDQNEKKRRPKWVTASRGQSPCVCKHWNWWNLLPHSPSSLSTKQFPCPCPAVLPVPLCQCTGELLQSRMCAGCAALCLAQQGAAHLSSSGGRFLQNLIILGTPAHWNGNLASWGIKSEGRRRAPSGSMTAANPISLETQAGKGGSVNTLEGWSRHRETLHAATGLVSSSSIRKPLIYGEWRMTFIFFVFLAFRRKIIYNQMLNTINSNNERVRVQGRAGRACSRQYWGNQELRRFGIQFCEKQLQWCLFCCFAKAAVLQAALRTASPSGVGKRRPSVCAQGEGEGGGYQGM